MALDDARFLNQLFGLWLEESGELIGGERMVCFSQFLLFSLVSAQLVLLLDVVKEVFVNWLKDSVDLSDALDAQTKALATEYGRRAQFILS